ncbi:hypothetical protein BKA56DRAFT_614007 [Ilyonectria sp. MPI-CAGE-AT-0026]|nr:hypothetical protein BKA56DRAFT_614007 [Ilyonectria sp. MPI-CAGE-AT-0026]
MAKPLITSAPKGADRVFDNRDLEPNSYCALWSGTSGSRTIWYWFNKLIAWQYICSEGPCAIATQFTPAVAFCDSIPTTAIYGYGSWPVPSGQTCGPSTRCCPSPYTTTRQYIYDGGSTVLYDCDTEPSTLAVSTVLGTLSLSLSVYDGPVDTSVMTSMLTKISSSSSSSSSSLQPSSTESSLSGTTQSSLSGTTQSSLSGTTQSSLSVTTSQHSSGHGASTGAIIGGVIGGLCVVGLIILGVIIILRRNPKGVIAAADPSPLPPQHDSGPRETWYPELQQEGVPRPLAELEAQQGVIKVDNYAAK